MRTTSRKWVQTVRSELVYRFNWTDPGTAAPLYTKAPPPVAPLVNWTGCYVGGGGGYGLWNQDNTTFIDGPPRTQNVDTSTTGGRGYFGTVQGGCDYQFGAGRGKFVVGAFGDYDFSNLKGKHGNEFVGGVADERMSSGWSGGGRAGWLVLPNLLTYFSAGYTEATFDRQNYTATGFISIGVPTGIFTDKQTYRGWFLGAGDEYSLGFVPGLFWKNEYRFSEFDTQRNPFRLTATGLPAGFRMPGSGPDHPQRAGLSLQLGRPGGCKVLIRPDGQTTEGPARRGFFVAQRRRRASRRVLSHPRSL